jgi:hypothetical protein
LLALLRQLAGIEGGVLPKEFPTALLTLVQKLDGLEGDQLLRQCGKRLRELPNMRPRIGVVLAENIRPNSQKHWRNRAEEARAIAVQMTDAHTKATMLTIAQDYEKLAERAEQRAR